MWQRRGSVCQRVGLRGVETDMAGGAGRVVGVEHRLDGPLAHRSLRVMPAVMRSQAMSASSWYMSWAG